MKQVIIIKLSNHLGGGNIVLDHLDPIAINYTLIKKKKFYNIFLILLRLILIKIKYSSKKYTLVASDPILTILLYFIGVKFIRFVQADDLVIFKKRIPILFFYLYKKFYKSSFKQKYFVNSVFVKKINDQRYRCQKNYLGIVYPGTNFKNIKGTKKEFFLIYVLRKAPWKGKDLFFNLLNNYDFSKNKILIIDVDNIFKENYGSNFKILKRINQKMMEQYFNKSQFYLSTSQNEGFGLPGIEAMSCSCIPLLPNIGGHIDYTTSQNCFLYDLNNIYSLVEVIKNAIHIKNDKTKINDLQKNCLLTSSKYNWDNTKNMFAKLDYNNVDR